MTGVQTCALPISPDRVVRQFGMIQEIPNDVDTDTVLHAIDLRGKVGVDLAMFRATKLENVEAATKAEEPEDKVETDSPTGNSETSCFEHMNHMIVK